MKKTHLIDFLELEVENYIGNGRIQYNKIEHYFKTYQAKGYKIYLQTDLDGKVENQNILYPKKFNNFSKILIPN